MQAPGFKKHPQHRVTINPAETAVSVRVGDAEVAHSERPLVLQESGYEAVYYLPIADIKAEMLQPSDTETYCPFKGTASYWHLKIGDTLIEDALWAYQDPFDECVALKDHTAFYLNKVSLTTQ